MLKFITDIKNKNEPDFLNKREFKTLMIVSLEGQLLGRYDAPEKGWTYRVLIELSHTFPPQWSVCGADALIGEQFVGSTEI